MKNQELAQIFYEIANFLDLEESAFRPRAYRKAGTVLETLDEDIEDIYRKGGVVALEKLSGIGKSIAEKIEEYLVKGKIKYHRDLKKRIPVKMEELTAIEGVRSNTVKILYRELGIKNLKDLTRAANSHKVASLPGLGEKSEKNILAGIGFLEKSKGRLLLGNILPVAREIENSLKILKEVEKISIAGSARRKKETIGDVDLLVSSKNPRKVIDCFVSFPRMIKVWGKGTTKSSIRLKQGLDVDLRVVPQKSYGAALQYFTGSKEHNIALRKIAQNKSLKLNEYGLFSGSKKIAGETETEVYNALGMEYIPPELRENRGEIKVALEGKLPQLIALKDIKGDLHNHSVWSDGRNSIKEMALAAIAKGYHYLGISDHTKSLQIERTVDERQLSQQRKEIDRLNKELPKFRIFQSAETNILRNGSIDIKDHALAKLDYAIAAVHSNFKMSKEDMTARMIKAMKNPYVKIIAHPTGRLLKLRGGYQLDFDKILRVAKQTGTILEINSQPRRLDLDDIKVKKAREAGVKLIINTDSHHIDNLHFMEFGVAQARRGWAEKKNIVNTYSLKKLLKTFNHESF